MRRVAVLAAAAALSAPAAAGTAAPIAVTLTDGGVAVSRDAAVAGTVTFAVVNRGRRPHRFSIAGRTTAELAPGRRARLSVTFRRAGTFLYGSGPFRAAFTVEPPPTAPAAPAPPAGCPAPTRTTVTVTIEDGRFRFSQTTVPCGIVTFVVTNRGDVDGEDEVDGLVLSVPGGVGRSLAKGQTASLVVALAPGRVDYTAGNYEKNYDGEYGTLVVTR